MGRAHDPRLAVGKQHRAAIGGQDRQAQPRCGGDQCVGLRACILRAVNHNHVGRVHLMHTDKVVGGDAHGLGHAGAVDLDHLGQVLAARAAVQPGIDAGARAAAAGEEPVWRVGKRVGGNGVKRHGRFPESEDHQPESARAL